MFFLILVQQVFIGIINFSMQVVQVVQVILDDFDILLFFGQDVVFKVWCKNKMDELKYEIYFQVDVIIVGIVFVVNLIVGDFVEIDYIVVGCVVIIIFFNLMEMFCGVKLLVVLLEDEGGSGWFLLQVVKGFVGVVLELLCSV